MRVSNFFLATLKESPQDAEIISHKLMLRAGLIRKLASGLYTWLPTGLRVLRKIEAIVRAEMERIQAQELLMPAIQPAELWIETQRWKQFGPLLLKLQDRHQREFCFGPTHEEVITDLIRREVKSYRQLPLITYQIQTKFRDEIRPRFGVMRAREFLMKDAYSFHLDAHSLQETYERVLTAYNRIFTRLGLKFRSVLADTGSIGGSISHEFHVLADSGEDLIAFSDTSHYAANIEQAVALAPTTPLPLPTHPLSRVNMQDIRTVDDQARHLNIPTYKILKTLLVRGKTAEHPIIALLIRGDHELNPLKAEKHPLIDTPCALITLEKMRSLVPCGPGFVGPKDLNIPLIADHSVLHMADFVCGTNQEGILYTGFNWGRDAEKPMAMDLRKVVAGDPSPDGQGTLSLARGIEVGHIFQLGEKYSRAMNASVLDESGSARTLSMGCYGIGISRIVAATIEQNHDEQGILWPPGLAPFQVSLIPISMHKSEVVREACQNLYLELINAGIEVLFDDRPERPGVMFSDSELLGIPHRIVLSEKSLMNNTVEYKSRSNPGLQTLNRAEVLPFLQHLLSG